LISRGHQTGIRSFPSNISRKRRVSACWSFLKRLRGTLVAVLAWVVHGLGENMSRFRRNIAGKATDGDGYAESIPIMVRDFMERR